MEDVTGFAGDDLRVWGGLSAISRVLHGSLLDSSGYATFPAVEDILLEIDSMLFAISKDGFAVNGISANESDRDRSGELTLGSWAGFLTFSFVKKWIPNEDMDTKEG